MGTGAHTHRGLGHPPMRNRWNSTLLLFFFVLLWWLAARWGPIRTIRSHSLSAYSSPSLAPPPPPSTKLPPYIPSSKTRSARKREEYKKPQTLSYILSVRAIASFVKLKGGGGYFSSRCCTSNNCASAVSSFNRHLLFSITF